MSKKLEVLFCLFLFLAAIPILTTVSPYTFPFPDRDQGVYAYVGGRLLHGQIPYRDMWDHKGPLIYFIYAAGFLIHPVYGVWLLGLIALWLAIFLSYQLLRRLFGSSTAFLAP